MKRQHLIRIAILSALFTQISHAANVFSSIDKGETNWFEMSLPYVFALSLELSIYIFTLYGMKKVATWFAVISFFINILYYWKEPALNFAFVAMVIISACIPLTIWFYSDLLQVDIKKAEAKKARLSSNRQSTKKISKPRKIKLVEVSELAAAN